MPHDFFFGLVLVAAFVIVALLAFLGWGTYQAGRRVFSSAFGDPTDRDRWLILVGFLVSIPLFTFIVFLSWGMETTMGVLTAGAILGLLCSPFTVRRYRREGPSLVAGAFVLTTLAGAYVSIFCAGTLIALSSG